MAAEMALFVVPDERAVVASRSRGHGGAFEFVACQGFDSADAVVEWGMYGEAPCAEMPALGQVYSRQWPEWVAPVVGDGTGVVAVPRGSTRALGHADPGEPRELAACRIERRRRANGDDTSDGDPLTIVRRVAPLAATAVDSDSALYCRNY